MTHGSPVQTTIDRPTPMTDAGPADARIRSAPNEPPTVLSPAADSSRAGAHGRAQAADGRTLDIDAMFEVAGGAGRSIEVDGSLFRRSRSQAADGGELMLDEFRESAGVSCLWLHLPSAAGQALAFRVRQAGRVEACVAGGWLVQPADPSTAASYWIPRPPMLRSFDTRDRVLVEQAADLVGFDASGGMLEVSFGMVPGLALESVIWRIPPGAAGLVDELRHRPSIETTPAYLWSSQSSLRGPADIYLHLIRGRVYQNARAWPRKWKFCCELDAFEIFVWLTGLVRATGKGILDLLRKQVLLSVIARQSADGGWYHGEWTDLFESHYRFHCGALLLLENALDEWEDATTRESLARGAAFVASKTDQTDLGLWFLHDSLEASVEAQNEMFRQTGTIAKGFGAWRPSRILGKSLPNKLILNTHVDTTVALHRYARTSGDEAIAPMLTSARSATRLLLARRPAEPLYRAVYRAVRLTMLPAARARALPLPVRAFKRLVWMHLLPNLYWLKRALPRIVMPGGYIDRHLSPVHFDGKYHAVNVLDLVRLWRHFPDEALEGVIAGGIDFVMGNGQATLHWWSEERPRQFAIVVFGEALYHLCTMRADPAYRAHLAQVLLLIEDLGLGLPPSILGGNAEITPALEQTPCPSPSDARLRIVNLGTAARQELLVVNPTGGPLELGWSRAAVPALEWNSSETSSPGAEGRILVPARGWILGKSAARSG